MTERDRRDRAVDQAYREHATDVYRIAYGILRDQEEAMDVTHDAFARAWERWDQYDSKRPLRGWLLGIAVHLALDEVRRRRVRRLSIAGFGRSSPTHLSAMTADASDDVVRRTTVEAALADLRPAARAAIVLRHYYGYAYEDIASMLGTTSGTVGSTLTRAHTAIRRALDARANRGRVRPPGRVDPPDDPLLNARRSDPPEVLR